jgi:hypothetical protein
MIKKISDEVTMHRHMDQIRLAGRQGSEANKVFVRFLANALDRIGSEKSLERRAPFFTEDVGLIEARKFLPVNGDEDPKFTAAINVVMKNEGTGYVNRDNGEEPSRFGILQSTAARYGFRGEIRNLTGTEGRAIYTKIWGESGAGNLPQPLSLVHFDTYVNSPAAARKFLAKCHGDAEAYLKQRGQRYQRLVELKPQRFGRYLNGWMNRIRNLRTITAEYKKAAQLAANMEVLLQSDGNLT